MPHPTPPSRSLCFLPPIPTHHTTLPKPNPLHSPQRPRHPKLPPPQTQTPHPPLMTTNPNHLHSPNQTPTPIPTPKQNPRIRPPSSTHFSIPFEDLIIRPWQPRDRSVCIQLIARILAEYSLNWDPYSADRDVVAVDSAYRHGEFWVVEHVHTALVLGTAAFYPVPHRAKRAVEIRKMYLDPSVRGRGLGKFLLAALEQRAFQLGYHTAFIETASVLKHACRLYQNAGYVPTDGLHTDRCDMVLQKSLTQLQLPLHEDHVEVVDMTRGWVVTCVTRQHALRHRLLFRAVVVMVESRGQIYVHKRSMSKSTYPGRVVAFVTGAVDWMEEPLDSAKREVEEELGITGLHYLQPFDPFLSRATDGLGQRIQFYPFIARGEFDEDDVTLDPDEVDSGMLMSRADIIAQGIGGSLWKEFREHGL